MSKKTRLLLITLSFFWFLAQVPAVFYGTQKLAIHMSYVGDEQAPINGALKILQDKSIFGLRNAQTVYYGPLFSIIALPAVVADFAEKMLLGKIHSALDYRDYIIWDWGGIVWKARLISVLFSFLILVILFKLFSTKTFNPKGNKLLPIVAPLILASNFIFFEYGHVFKHWIFVLFSLAGMLYSVVRLYETNEKKYYTHSFLYTIFGFGVSYLNGIFLIMWLPLLIKSIKNKKYQDLKRFFIFATILVVAAAVVVVWNPHPFVRLLGLSTGDITNSDTSSFSSEKSPIGFSFGYYSRVLINNEFALLIAVAILLVYLCTQRKIYNEPAFYFLVLPLLVFFGIFGVIGHHESRYVLPSMLLILVLCTFLLSRYFTGIGKKNKYISVILVTLISFSAAFNLMIIGLNISIQAKGPKEMALIKDLKEIQIKEPLSKTLVVKYYLLGTAHTKDAYRDYIGRTNKTGVNLYKFILGMDIPTEHVPLSAYYAIPDGFKLTEDLMKRYDHIAYYYEFAAENRGSVEPDYFDLHPLYFLYHKALSDYYYFIK